MTLENVAQPALGQAHHVAAAIDVIATFTVATLPLWWPITGDFLRDTVFIGGITVGLLRGAVLVFDLIHKYRRYKKGD